MINEVKIPALPETILQAHTMIRMFSLALIKGEAMLPCPMMNVRMMEAIVAAQIAMAADMITAAEVTMAAAAQVIALEIGLARGVKTCRIVQVTTEVRGAETTETRTTVVAVTMSVESKTTEEVTTIGAEGIQATLMTEVVMAVGQIMEVEESHTIVEDTRKSSLLGTIWAGRSRREGSVQGRRHQRMSNANHVVMLSAAADYGRVE